MGTHKVQESATQISDHLLAHIHSPLPGPVLELAVQAMGVGTTMLHPVKVIVIVAPVVRFYNFEAR